MDRKPRVKHMAGPFFSEGKYTKNSHAEVNSMISHLELLCEKNANSGDLDDYVSEDDMGDLVSLYVPLTGMKRMVDIPKFMGRW